MDFRDTRDTFLILTPAQLAPQWQKELQEKFGLDFVCNYDDDFRGFDAHDKIIASVDTAKSKTNREDVLARRWDVAVLDEAHYVRNADTMRYELIDELSYGRRSLRLRRRSKTIFLICTILLILFGRVSSELDSSSITGMLLIVMMHKLSAVRNCSRS